MSAKWPRVRLDQCTEIVSGATPSTSVETYWGGDVCWATPKDLSELDGSYISDTPRKLTREGLRNCAAAILPAGSVLFSSRAPIGHVAVNTVPMATNQGFKSFVPKPERTDAKFLYWWVRTNRAFLESLGNGATFKEVSKATVSRIEIPLPPLAEQRRIAEVLDQAEALRAKRRAALAQLDSLTQSIFLDLFGDPARNPKEWPTRPLGELGDGPAAIVDGPFGSAISVKDDYVEDGEIPVIRTKNVRPFEFVTDDLKRITREKFRGLERSSVIPGDILLTKVGTIGHVCFFPATFELAVLSTTGSCRIRPNELLVQRTYLAHFLNLYRKEMLKLVAEGVQPFLNMRHIKSFIVPLPPIELQREFARRVTAVEKLKTAQRASLAELDALFASLQHRAFRGEL